MQNELFFCMHFLLFSLHLISEAVVYPTPVLLTNLNQIHVQRQDARVWTEYSFFTQIVPSD
jgi:uncharacterized PurR-regulated membrane protein YhhQ (DUF165 family)